MPGKVVWGVLIALLVGCEERERLVFDPVPVDHEGPISHIDPPSRDTTLLEGDAFVIGGLSVDPSGVDTLYIEVEGVDALHDRIKSTVKVVMPIATQFYGMREFAIEDPDGYVITFAQRV